MMEPLVLIQSDANKKKPNFRPNLILATELMGQFSIKSSINALSTQKSSSHKDLHLTFKNPHLQNKDLSSHKSLKKMQTMKSVHALHLKERCEGKQNRIQLKFNIKDKKQHKINLNINKGVEKQRQRQKEKKGVHVDRVSSKVRVDLGKSKVLDDRFQKSMSKQVMKKTLLKSSSSISTQIKVKNLKLTFQPQTPTQSISLTDRSLLSVKSTKSTALPSYINIDNSSSQMLTSKHSNSPSCNYFRKSSKTSTSSLLTKHTQSLHQFQPFETEDLFDNSIPSSFQKRPVDNILNALQMTKKKIYEQIYCLDKKLLIQQPPKKRSVLINLRRKPADEKKAEKQYNR